MLTVSDLEWIDEVPLVERRTPLSCRLHLWHRWVRVYGEGTSYVACERCDRLPTPTIFDQPLP
ncbi:hypothetical protein [Nocardioides sp.]|uniref:hypothetical protein n=1 Tax=Nocardioides sp. TaxID=35761 RepID=UPI003D0C46A8